VYVSVEPWVWAVFTCTILGILALDLLLFHRRAHEVSVPEALAWCGVWTTLSLGFAGLLWGWQGGDAAGEYLAGYLIELSLSMDNVFVFAMLFAYFAVPAAHQHRVLFWGVLGAIVLRGIFIVAGAVLLERFHWAMYVFGLLLVVTGARMLFAGDRELHPEQNPVLTLFRRLVPMTSDYHGQSFAMRQGGRLVATPLLAVLVVVETTDVVFAIDSVPAIFAVTRDPFLVFTSNAFAILGLRNLYFLLAGMMRRFVYLKAGLGVLLGVVGAKMLLNDVFHPPIWASLAAIVTILSISVIASLWATRQGGTPVATPRGAASER
jgi:tellurite resistance protein TerC